MKRVLILIVALGMLASGCAKPSAKPPAPVESVTPRPVDSTPTSAPVAAADPSSAELLDRPDKAYLYRLNDGTTAQEYYIRDGERLIGSYNGKTYVTWFINQDGVWRTDPKGQTLLRYLPPTLKEGAWKQTSGGEEIWFNLRNAGECRLPPGNRPFACWELTVLNRMERTVFRLSPGLGIIEVRSENYKTPADSYRKEIVEDGKAEAVSREMLVKEGAKLPTGALPSVAEVSLKDFEAASAAIEPRQTVDLNGDGTAETIVGPVGQWTTLPLALYAGGREITNAFDDVLQYSRGYQHRLDLLPIKGFKGPALVYQVGTPGETNTIHLQLFEEKLESVFGWHRKTDRIFAESVRVEPDGLVAVTADADQMGGYTYTRWFRIQPMGASSGWKYEAKLDHEEIKAGRYPAKVADLVTAALVARWWGLEADLARYVPDPAVREKIKVGGQPAYDVEKAEVGALAFKDAFPIIEGRQIAVGEPYDFLVRIGQYEGFNYYAGKVTFAKQDGRDIISKFEVTKTDFIY